MRQTKFVLSIGGGGIKGKIASRFLKHLEKELGEPIGNVFDLLVGTSIGGLLCSSYSNGRYNARFTDDGIFNKYNYTRIMSGGIVNKILGPLGLYPKYNGKRKVIDQYLRGIGYSNSNKNIMIIAYDVTNDKPHFFKSWDCKPNLLVADVVDASSAAPGYFPPVYINGNYYMDGGIAVNYPEDCAYAEALRLWGPEQDIRVLSIGTGKVRRQIKPKSWWGLGEWVLQGDVLSLLFDGEKGSEEYKLEQSMKAMNHKYLLVDGFINNNSLDDISDDNVKLLETIADKLWEKYKEQVIKLLKEDVKKGMIDIKEKITFL